MLLVIAEGKMLQRRVESANVVEANVSLSDRGQFEYRLANGKLMGMCVQPKA